MTHHVPTNLLSLPSPLQCPLSCMHLSWSPTPASLALPLLIVHSSRKAWDGGRSWPLSSSVALPSRDFGLLQSTMQIPFSLCTMVWKSLELTLCRTKHTLTNACSGSSFHRYHLPDALTVRIAAEESQCPDAFDPRFSASPCFCMVKCAQSKSLPRPH